MAKRIISNLDLKIKFIKEYLDNGGVEKIPFPELLQDLIKIKFDQNGKADPDSISPHANAMMMALLGSHMMPPFFSSKHTSEYKSTLQKSNSFVQENIDTIEQFDTKYEEYKTKTDTLFRGQREAKWRLYSKLQRVWILEKLYQKENYQLFLEKMVELGKQEYGPQIQNLLQAKHDDVVNSIAVLGYLQHHGCPTPLLDWTYRFQNALYFAIDGLIPNSGSIEIEDYCSVYFIEEKFFDDGNLSKIIEEGLDREEEIELQRLFKFFSNGDEEKRLAMQKHFSGRKLFDRNKIIDSGLISHMTKIENMMSYMPIAYFSDKDSENGIKFSLNNSKNIQNQEGVFTWNNDPSKPIELIGDELYKEGRTKEEANDYSFCSCFNISKKLEPYIRKRLEADGITKEFIYPTSDLNTWSVFEKVKLE